MGDISENEQAAVVERHLRKLVAWAHAARREALPQEVLTRAAMVIADDVAVAVSTQDEPEVRQYQELLLANSGASGATVFRTGAPRTDRYAAAVANAVAMTTAEFDEGYQLTPCHAGLYTVPALVAEAEVRDVRVADVVVNEALAYEIITRVARGWKAAAGAYPPLYTHSRYSALGAAGASALIRGVDSPALLGALSNAATVVTMGPRNHLLNGAMVRNVWPGVGAWNGMMSVDWALCGITALPSAIYDVFSGVAGFTALPAALTVDLGEDWAVLHSYNRMHACHLSCNGLVESLLELRPNLLDHGKLEQIVSIAVEIHPEAETHVERHPATTLAARFSLPHLAAGVLVQGHAGVAAFATATLSDPLVSALREKVTVRRFDMRKAGGHKWPAAATVRMQDGRSYTATCINAPGGHDNPPFPPEKVLQKIEAITAPTFAEFAAAARKLVRLDPDALAMPWKEFIRGATRSR